MCLCHVGVKVDAGIVDIASSRPSAVGFVTGRLTASAIDIRAQRRGVARLSER